MIPILYDSSETAFSSNGLGRLRDCATCTVTEERNGIYECEFTYPVDGAHFDEILLGRIIAVEHDYSNDVQPFDITQISEPIDGLVTFHATHISYRLSKCVATASNVQTMASALSALSNAVPDHGFTFESDMSGSGYVSAFDGTPMTVKSLLGGVEGSLLDTFGGEYLFDKFSVQLKQQRGVARNLTVRYGLNMTDYNDDLDITETYNACIAYWKGQSNNTDVIVKTDLVSSGLASYSGRTECIALDLTDKFESQPTVAQLTTAAQTYMSSNQTNMPSRTIKVSFINLRDTTEYAELLPLFDCNLCDSIKVVFPRYGLEGTFKIVKTVYDVLLERFDEMELGNLSLTLSEALGLGGKK